MAQDIAVICDLFRRLQIEPLVSGLEIDDGPVYGIGEVEKYKRATGSGVQTSGEREDLHSDVRPLSNLDQMQELFAHHLRLGRCGRPGEGRLVNDGPQAWWLLLVEDALTPLSSIHDAFDVFRRCE